MKLMADINERKRDDDDAGKKVGTGEGDFSGDTMATALESFGTVAGVVASAVAGGELGDKEWEGAVGDDVLGYPKKEKKQTHPLIDEL